MFVCVRVWNSHVRNVSNVIKLCATLETPHNVEQKERDRIALLRKQKD